MADAADEKIEGGAPDDGVPNFLPAVIEPAQLPATVTAAPALKKGEPAYLSPWKEYASAHGGYNRRKCMVYLDPAGSKSADFQLKEDYIVAKGKKIAIFEIPYERYKSHHKGNLRFFATLEDALGSRGLYFAGAMRSVAQKLAGAPATTWDDMLGGSGVADANEDGDDDLEDGDDDY